MKRSHAAGLLWGGIAATAATSLIVAYALHRPALAPIKPPAALPPPSKNTVEKLLEIESKNPEQFWYDRGYDGETLGFAPALTDIWFALGAREKKAGLLRRDVHANPPSDRAWADAGITRRVVGPLA